jgi:hypothetical protein
MLFKYAKEDLAQGCVLDCAELMEVVAKKGSWYSYKDIRYTSSFIEAYTGRQ